MKECNNSKIHISSNFILSINLLIMFDTLLLRPSLHCTHSATLHHTSPNYTSLHFSTLHPTTLHYTSPHFTQLHFTTLRPTTLHYTSPHFTQLHFTTLHPTTLHYTYRHFTSSHLHFTTLSFSFTHLHFLSYCNCTYCNIFSVVKCCKSRVSSAQ